MRRPENPEGDFQASFPLCEYRRELFHLPEARYEDIVMPKRFTKTVSKYTAELNPLDAAIS